MRGLACIARNKAKSLAQLTHKVMNKQQYIKKARVLLENFDGWREYDEDAHNEFLEALYQLHQEGVREIENEIDEKVKLYHKTCLISDFDNGQFWAYKDMQQFWREKLKK